jgi:MFS family permease
MANPLLLPAINHLLRNSYSGINFGRLYGYSSSINKIMMLLSTFSFGLILDMNYFSFIYFYPVISIFGAFSIYILTMIKDESEPIVENKKPLFTAVKDSFINSLKILRQNKPYRDFEIGFGLYGWAWLSTVAVITIFFDSELELNFSSIAFYKNAYNIIAIVSLPFFGKLIGKIDPRKFAAYTFAAMFFHLLFLGLTQYIPNNYQLWGLKIYYSLIASYLSYGLFAAMMALLWYIGSAYFCKKDEVSSYQSIHLTLTGVRGILAPLIGVFIYELIGFTGVFILALLSLLIAIVVMIKSTRKFDLK